MPPHPTPRLCKGLAARLFVALSLLMPSIAAAQEMPVRVRDQFPILLKALTFDRSLSTRCADTLVIGILYQSRFRQSEDAKKEFMSIGQEIASSRAEEIPVRFVPIDLSLGTILHAEILAHRVNTLYVTPLRGTDLKRVIEATRKSKVLTLTGISAYVDSGLSIGVESKDRQPSLVINRRAYRAEGADLDSQLLEIARIIR